MPCSPSQLAAWYPSQRALSLSLRTRGRGPTSFEVEADAGASKLDPRFHETSQDGPMPRLQSKRKAIYVEEEGIEPKKKKLHKDEAHCYGWIEDED